MHVNCPNWTKFSNGYENGDDEVLCGFRIWLWEHLGEGSYSPMHPDPRWSDLSQTRTYLFRFPGSVPTNGFLSLLGLSTTYREFLLLRPEPRTPGSSARRHSSSQSSGSKAESSENKTPAPKKRRTSHPRNPRHMPCPEVMEVTDEDDAPTTTDNPRNYNF
jgi:hypothetical protein